LKYILFDIVIIFHNINVFSNKCSLGEQKRHNFKKKILQRYIHFVFLHFLKYW